MRLKSLEIQGYKSFANKMQVLFDGGLTAIVGPNGSGKSNVVDAIRWVLGEQSYGTLRGRKTADMIFSGSDGRARLSMAAVTLQFDNTARWLPLDFSEVTVSRRAYRSGENEYYLNGSRVRLRDVTELLSQGGLSRQTYTVIGQGTIDRILSLQSAERRRLFEEAAGIVFHRQKREETLTRLQATQENLLRVHDLVQELEPQVKRLARQAERVSEYQQMLAELAEQLTIWYGYRWQLGQRQRHQAEVHQQTCEQSLQIQQTQLTEVEATLTELQTEQQSLRAELGAAYTQRQTLSQQVEAVQREVAVIEERTRQFAVQQTDLATDLQVLEETFATQTTQIEADSARLATLGVSIKEAQSTLAEREADLNAHQQQQQAIISQRDDLLKQQQTVLTALTEQQAALRQVGERRAALLQEQQTRQTELTRLADEQESLRGQQADFETHMAHLSQQLDGLTQARDRQRDRVSELQAQVKQWQAEVAPLTRQQEQLRARQEALSRLRQELEGYHGGVRAVLAAAASGEPAETDSPSTSSGRGELRGIIGPLGQLIEVPPALEVAVETALGGRLQDIVVETFADAQAAIEYLKRQRAGRATLLPLDTLRVPSAVSAPRQAGVIGVAATLVGSAPHLRKVVEFTLNRTVIAADLAAAQQALKRMQGGFTIVTVEGEIVRSGGAVTGGVSKSRRGESGTVLAREREWRALPSQIEAVQRQGQTIVDQIEAAQEDISRIEQTVAELSEQRRAVRETLQAVQTEAEQASRALAQATSRVEWQTDLQNKAQAELTQLAVRQMQTERALTQLQTQQESVAESVAQISAEIAAAEGTDLRAAVNAAQTAVATLRERQQRQQATLHHQQRLQRQTYQQIEAKSARAESLSAEQVTLQTQRENLSQQQQTLSAQVGALSTEIESTEVAVATVESRLTEQRQVEKGLRQQWQRLEATLRQATIEAARRTDEQTSLLRHIEDDLGVILLELDESAAVDEASLLARLPDIAEVPDGLEARLKQTRNKLRRLGNINREAVQEHAELRQRYDFLTSQVADLETAVADLRAVISKLDGVMQEAFTVTFQKVSVEFKQYFRAMFGGGEANIVLTEPDDLSNTGVDIMARPPGKRLQSMALLSGGERSLTAQALIFALLSISPTPFVVFDEVDAMLDEANVSRFRDALVGLSSEIQFIVVTHNRKTIEAANTIYGVSMGGDSVSRLYALKLDEWESKLGQVVK